MELSEKIMSTSRRKFLTGVAGTAVIAADGKSAPAFAASASKDKPFPKNFRWGVATAGHQIEGNNTNSDLWFLREHQTHGVCRAVR